MLSPEVQQRLDAARLAAPNYQPNKDISAKLGEKTLIMVVGPAAIGKTHIMKQIPDIDPRFSLTSVFSTRDPRPDDDKGMFTLFPHDNESVTELLDRIDEGEVVQYAVHATQDRIYGTTLNDYHSEYNLLATLSSGVDQIRQLPFKGTHVIGLTAENAFWTREFNRRYRPSNPDRQKRLGEAAMSLEWLLHKDQRGFVEFVENIEGDPSYAAQKIVNIALTGEEQDTYARTLAGPMLIWARSAQTPDNHSAA